MPTLEFFPERRQTVRRFLEQTVMLTSRNHDETWPNGKPRPSSPRSEFDSDEVDLSYGGPGPPSPHRPGGVKLWQLLVLLFSLFSGHYLLVQKTISEANKDLKYELVIAQRDVTANIADLQRRDASADAVDVTIMARLNQLEAEQRRHEQDILVLQVNQKNVMKKLGMNP